MDPYSSGEDLVKTRKPYTITKQRERWTEEEHNRFLEALKLYGRAWQRIEEYIGTKTAVQIRSHAQKFFTKLEKEAVIKGTPAGHALDIKIPPPRPKRKPSNPYPRKTSVGAKDGKTSNLYSPSSEVKTTMDMDKEPEKPVDDGKLGNNERHSGKDDCSDLFYASSLSANESSSLLGKSCISKEDPSLSNEASNKNQTNKSYITTETRGLSADISYGKQLFQENGLIHASSVVKSGHGKQLAELNQSESIELLPSAGTYASQNCPRHAPVHILDQNLGMPTQNASSETRFTEPLLDHLGGVSGPKKLFPNVAAPGSSEHHATASCSSFPPAFPCYHPFSTPIQNQDNYRSFLHISSSFSSLVVSALLQNPAAHAVASFTATLWPYVNAEAAMESPGGPAEACQSRQSNSAPSVAAIAAATVAAATSWWAAHGLLPLCAPFHPGFTCSPALASTTPTDSQTKAASNERRERSPVAGLGGQQLELECSEALHEQHSALKSPVASSSSGESQGAKGLAAAETTQLTDEAEMHGANKSKNKKQVDRSSCGSNTPSSSEVEADSLEKHTKEDEEKLMKDKESKELDTVHYISEPFGRRCRSTCSVNESWKEVSEEGRLAFEALFSREVLPQSFSPLYDLKNQGKDANTDKLNAEVKDNLLQFDLNRMTCDTCSQKQEVEENVSLISLNKEDDPLNLGLGHAKLRARRTGFKPYKRCSMEAKDIRASGNCQDEEQGLKRLRLEREASN